jgi:hypothetical protein
MQQFDVFVVLFFYSCILPEISFDFCNKQKQNQTNQVEQFNSEDGTCYQA